jgi:hypothetical protein
MSARAGCAASASQLRTAARISRHAWINGNASKIWQGMA